MNLKLRHSHTKSYKSQDAAATTATTTTTTKGGGTNHSKSRNY
jgi:hypothetical protein